MKNVTVDFGRKPPHNCVWHIRHGGGQSWNNIETSEAKVEFQIADAEQVHLVITEKRITYDRPTRSQEWYENATSTYNNPSPH